MPHGVINSETFITSEAIYLVNGVFHHDATLTRSSGLTQYPASVNNPKILGYRAPANWYARRHRWVCSGGSVYWRQILAPNTTLQAVGQISYFWYTDALPFAKFDPGLADSVLRTCLSTLVEDDVAFNAFLLQGKQSLRMVANLATGIAHGTDKLMYTEFKRPKAFRKFLRTAGDSAIRNFSSKYLEFLYGWKPLADDVENAFQSMLDGYTGPEQKRFRLTARKAKKLKSTEVIQRNTSLYWVSGVKWQQTLYRENRAKVVLHYEFPSQAGEMLPTMTPFGTAWELTPWSFVIDWFVPIGDWIGAMEATQYSIYMRDAVLTQSVKVSSRNDSRSRWSTALPSPSGYTSVYGAPPTASGYSFVMSRQVLSPSAVLDRIRFPDFSSKFGLPQASQALALLSQVLNKWF